MPRIEELRRALIAWSPGSAPATSWLLPELRDLLKAEFAGAYRPVASERGWTLDFMHGAGASAANNVRVFQGYVAELPCSETFLAQGNPHLIHASQRNRAMRIPDIARLQDLGELEACFLPFFRRMGLIGHDQLRMLVCDGPRQLAWVGATRAEPFTDGERRILQRLAKPLRERLRLEHQFRAPALLVVAFEAVLEALPTAAFVIGPNGCLEVANAAGLVLWERDRKQVLEAIRDSEARGPDQGAFTVTQLVAPGCPDHLLAIRKQPADGLERVLRAQRAWGLSVRQARVLELVATGASNKQIASILSCSVATVENHLTELFRRSSTTSRTSLIARLLFDAPRTG